MSLVGLIENAEEQYLNRPEELGHLPKREAEEFDRLFNTAECFIPIETIIREVVPSVIEGIIRAYNDQQNHISQYHVHPDRVKINPTEAEVAILSYLCQCFGVENAIVKNDRFPDLENLYITEKYPNISHGVYKKQRAIYRNYQFCLIDGNEVVEVQDTRSRKRVSISIRNSISIDEDGNYHYSSRLIFPGEIGSVIIGNCRKAVEQAHAELEMYKGTDDDNSSSRQIIHLDGASYLVPTEANIRNAHYVQTLNVLPVEGYAAIWRRNIMVGFKG